MERLKIFNARIITPDKMINNGCLVIENGKIDRICDENIHVADGLELDADFNYVSPGFIDIHTHGGGGHDFMDATVEAFLGAAEKHAQHGTTSMLPTTVACSNEELKNTIQAYKIAKTLNTNGADLLGLHLEGPYISDLQKGALNSRYIRNPKPEEYMEILNWSDDILRWSAAPELSGALEFGKYIKDKGILPSIAHTDAVHEQVLEAFENGYTHITHLYSGMSGVRRINAYRYAGVIESAFLIDGMTVEIIADGCHLPASLLKLVYKMKGSSKIALVTDSIRAAGLLDGESVIGSLENGQKVIIEDGVAKLPDRTAFAGSVATMDRLVRTVISLADVPLMDAVRMATITPASIVHASGRKGSIVIGKDADIVIFDNQIDIKTTIIKGKIVFQKSKDC